MFNIKRQTFLYNCFSGTLIYNFTKLKKEIFLKKKKMFSEVTSVCGGCSTSRAGYGNDEMNLRSKRHDKTSEFSFYKNTQISFQCTQTYKSHFWTERRNVDNSPNNQKYCTIIYNKQFL